MNSNKRILSLYDYTGIACKPYRDAGYNVEQVDIKHGTDARLIKYFDDGVYGILASPVCTKFAVSGARWHRTDEEYAEALHLFDVVARMVMLYSPKFWYIENPISKVVRWYGKPKHYFHPYEYAAYGGGYPDEAFTKKTGLHGNFIMPPKDPLPPILGSKMHTSFGGKSEKTKEERSKWHNGFALAFFLYNQ